MTDADPRPATPADLPEVTELVSAAYARYADRMDHPPGPVLTDHGPAIAAGQVWLLGEPIAGLIVLVPQGDALLIENVAVAPAAQGAGLGSRLMDFAERQASARGLRRITLYTNELMTENQAIYAHLGYHETERRTEADHRRVYMEKLLPDAPG